MIRASFIDQLEASARIPLVVEPTKLTRRQRLCITYLTTKLTTNPFLRFHRISWCEDLCACVQLSLTLLSLSLSIGVWIDSLDASTFPHIAYPSLQPHHLPFYIFTKWALSNGSCFPGTQTNSCLCHGEWILGQQLDPGPGASGLSRLGLSDDGLSGLTQLLEID